MGQSTSNDRQSTSASTSEERSQKVSGPLTPAYQIYGVVEGIPPDGIEMKSRDCERQAAVSISFGGMKRKGEYCYSAICAKKTRRDYM